MTRSHWLWHPRDIRPRSQFTPHERAHVPSRPSPPKKELAGLKAYNKCNSTRKKDELQRYQADDSADDDEDLLQWWINNQERYPVLKDLAFTLLAAPASTAADERLFSFAGNVVNEQRPHTQQELAQAVQCLRSWHQGGLI